MARSRFNKVHTFHLKKQHGQTLVEVLVAFAIALIVISAITKATLSSLTGAQFAKNQNLARQYSQQGLETLRAMRDTTFATYKALPSGTYCMASGCSAIVNNGGDGNCGNPSTCSPNINNVFVRTVTIAATDATCTSPTATATPTPTPPPGTAELQGFITSQGKSIGTSSTGGPVYTVGYAFRTTQTGSVKIGGIFANPATVYLWDSNAADPPLIVQNIGTAGSWQYGSVSYNIPSSQVGSTFYVGIQNVSLYKFVQLNGSSFSTYTDATTGFTILSAFQCFGTNATPYCASDTVPVFDGLADVTFAPGAAPTPTPPPATTPTKVTVNVAWSDGGCPTSNPYCHKVSQSTCLNDINALPTP